MVTAAIIVAVTIAIVAATAFDFGLAKLGPQGDKMHPLSRVISVCAKNGGINDACNMLYKISRRNLDSWNTMVSRYLIT